MFVYDRSKNLHFNCFVYKSDRLSHKIRSPIHILKIENLMSLKPGIFIYLKIIDTNRNICTCTHNFIPKLFRDLINLMDIREETHVTMKLGLQTLIIY